MANYTNLTDLFTAIADSIRAKTNSIEPIVADNFPEAINNLRTGFDYNNSDVTTLPDYAFYGCEDLNNVDCPGLTSIGVSAFENCANLESVVLYEDVGYVGENAFKGCTNTIIYCHMKEQPEGWHKNWNPDGCEVVWLVIETWDISAASNDNVIAKLYNDTYNDGMYSLTISGDGTMKDYSSSSLPWRDYCHSIVSMEILNGVTNIGDYAFYDCTSLTNTIIPDNVTSIGRYAFYNCKALTDIIIPISVTSIDRYAFNYCSALKSVNISDITAWCGISFGSESANPLCYAKKLYINGELLTDLVIPDGITNIGAVAFYNCTSLTNITIPNSVTSISTRAFYNCTGLTSVIIPNSVATIGESAFDGCEGLTSVTIPNTVTSIGDYVFDGCEGLTTAGPIGGNYNIQFGWTDNIPDYAFSYCSGLTSIVIPDSVVSVGNDAFKMCLNLTSVNISNINAWCGIRFGSQSANPLYYAKKLYVDGELVTDLIISGSVTSIGNYAFSDYTPLTSVTISDGVTSIGRNAFSRCTNLTSVIVPNSVTSIGTMAFSGCGGLTTAGPVGGGYNYEFRWTDIIPEYAFDNCTALTSIIIPDGITSICRYAFSNCTGLTSVIIPDSVTYIGERAFLGCTGFTSIDIPSNVTGIDDNAFYTCTGLTSVNISDIAAWCNISFHSSGANPLYCAKNLYLNDELVTDLVIPDGVTSIGGYVFYNCTSLTSIIIPNGVTSIGAHALRLCSGLTSITIPDSVVNIGTYAFASCSGLASINYAGTVSQWKAVSFGGFWNSSTNTYTIHCTDGTITKDGVVTYY